MKVGDKVRVYDKVDSVTETCSHGDKHIVPVYSIKTIHVYAVRSEHIPHLHYTHGGYGDVLYAIDHQGRGYRKEPHWDGPRATRWMRDDGKTFTQYPTKTFSRDLTGRSFIP